LYERNGRLFIKGRRCGEFERISMPQKVRKSVGSCLGVREVRLQNPQRVRFTEGMVVRKSKYFNGFEREREGIFERNRSAEMWTFKGIAENS
jgi:hypothetical protein